VSIVPDTKTEVVDLLVQASKDWDAWDMRVRHMSDRYLIGQFYSVKHWYKKYPVAYAKERLIVRGSVVVPILVEIIQDPQYEEIQFFAWDVLGKLNPPLFLEELYKAGKNGLLSPKQVLSQIRFFLPIHRHEDFWHEDKVMDWLGQQLVEKTFDQIILDAMDRHVSADVNSGGMHPIIRDSQVFRWLDRAHDMDLNTWLAVNAPNVLAFRQEQLAKGYDPVTAFSLSQNIGDDMLDEAMAAIYPRAEDREACKELFLATYPSLLSGGRYAPLRAAASDGWLERFRDWYRSQRPYLRYDPELLRFVSHHEDAGNQSTAIQN